MAGNVPILSGRHLAQSYGNGELRTQVLSDVSIDLHRGEIALLMGRSGSGKSTLLSLLSGLQKPDSGTVTVLGRHLWAMSEREREEFRLRHFGFVFQGFNLFRALTVYQQMELILRWGEQVPRREARTRVHEMLDRLGLAKKAKLRPEQLSGGEKQRVAIGRALIKKPSLCFADEPTSALDWGHGQRVMELLRESARDLGATVLVVAHDARLIPFSDRLLEMDDGRLLEPEAAPVEGSTCPSCFSTVQRYSAADLQRSIA